MIPGMYRTSGAVRCLSQLEMVSFETPIRAATSLWSSPRSAAFSICAGLSF